MHDDHSEVRLATFYRPHGIYDTEANMNELETDGYYVIWAERYFLNFDNHCSSAKTNWHL